MITELREKRREEKRRRTKEKEVKKSLKGYLQN